MAKRQRTQDFNREDRYEYIKRGYEYEPFIKIQDVPSLGRSSRRMGIKTSRQHEFLSDLERNIYLVLEYSDNVFDIREQFPLELKKTLLIAEELGVKHPTNPKTKKPIIMTSDFCITIKNGDKTQDVIRTAKYKDALADRRTIEKLQIEELYWKHHGLDWGIITECEISKNYCMNIDDVLKYYQLYSVEGFAEIAVQDCEDIILAFLQRIITAKNNIRAEISQFERDLHLQSGAGIALFKHLLARKYISVDMDEPLSFDKNLEIRLTGKSKALGEVVSWSV